MDEDSELEELKNNLKTSFSRIRTDIKDNSERLNQLEKEKHMLLDAIESLSKEVKNLRTSLSLKAETESHLRPQIELKESQNRRLVSPHETMGSQLEGKSETNQSQNLRLVSPHETMGSQPEGKSETNQSQNLRPTKSHTRLRHGIKPSDTLESEFMRQFKQNKSEIIKYKMLSTIQEQPLTCTALKDQIVESKKYCSKASFYRYYRELKKQGFIKVIEHEDQQFLVLGERFETA